MPADPQEITVLLKQWQDGDREAESRLWEMLLPDIRRLAARYLGRERPNHSLQRTDLVHEIYFKLHAARIDWQNRGHFFAITARMMRRFLIDYARRRPKAEFLPIDGLPEAIASGRNRIELAIAVDRELEELDKVNPLCSSVIVLISFLGLSVEEAAQQLGVSKRKAERLLHDGKVWLAKRLGEKACNSAKTTTSA
ncbi:MAG TPA: ECF-type sigma factor [Candidatus Angelobacter sp.]|nr:ECF-type sigma factor [Candidatus Angelobacter sp.]